jgi:glyoxylase-like metal-dependent hydrolase (beta-lactamase superfamily II)
MQKYGKNIFVEASYPGVTVGAVVTADGVICIDTPTRPADARRWRQQVARLSKQPILFVINLDHQRDRVSGNQWFEAPVIAHEATAERLRMLPEQFRGSLSEAGADVDLASDFEGVRLVPPQVTFTDQLLLVKGGVEVHLVHRPGSAAGAIWVELPREQVAFVGDAVAHKVPPFMQDANLDQWLEALAELQKARFPARHIIPGRGAPLTKKSIKPAADFLKVVRRKVEAVVRAKKGRPEAAALAEDLLDYFSVPATLREHYTRRLRSGLEHVYDVLAGAA